MDGETIGWTGGWPDGRVNGAGRRGWVSGQDGWMGRPLDGRADGRADGPTDGRVNGAGRRRWVNGPDGWMDEETIELTGDPTDG